MQMFIAELSTPIDKVEFERSWRSAPSGDGPQPTAEFTFVGRKVSALIDSDSSERWSAANFYRAFSAAVRRLDRDCNIRWL
jgi:hypothetical protein